MNAFKHGVRSATFAAEQSKALSAIRTARNVVDIGYSAGGEKVTPRYAGRVGSIVCGQDTLDIWMVIQTNDAPRDEVLAAGFEPVPLEMSDDAVRERYRVKEIYQVTDDERKVVN